MFYAFNDFRPVVDPSAYVHPQATVIGDVVIGKDVYIGPGCVLRGDWGRIDIHDGCNVQENCTIHMFPGVTVVLEKNAHIGHGAVIHGAHIGENSLVGMNAVVMDDVVIGKECIVGALAFVAQGTHIPDRKIVVGNPAKIVKDVTDEVAEWKGEGTRLYQTLPNQWRSNTAECVPLRALESNRPEHPQTYFPKQKR